MRLFFSSARPFQRGHLQAGPAVVFLVAVSCIWGIARGDTLSGIHVNGITRNDSLPPVSGSDIKDSVAPDAGPVVDSLSKKISPDTAGLTNVVLTQKNIRAYGWGEYKVGGRCLCCDNLLDGDCIVIHTTNRTEKERIKQIVDGKTEADAKDKSTYFGDVEERERAEPVRLLMAEITLKKMVDVYRVTVYTMIDKEKKRSVLSNCEFGYYDQFDRLQWVGKAENKGNADHIAFTLARPVFTKSILLKVKGGKNRITEVAIFGRNEKK